MKTIFATYNLFHLILAVCKCYTVERSSERALILIDNGYITNAEDIIGKFKDFIDWCDFKIFNDKKISDEFYSKSDLSKLFNNLSLIKYYERRNQEIKSLDLNDSEIFIFNDSRILSRYLILKKGNVILLEDGMGNYLKYNYKLRDHLKKLFGIYPPMGRNPKIKKIHVQSPENLPDDIKDKGVSLDIGMILTNIPQEIKEKIFNIFIDEKTFTLLKKTDTEKKKILVITQPISEIKLCSEEKKVKLYRDLLTPYLNDENVIFIKPHPYEKTNYSNIFGNSIIVIPSGFPIEIFNYDKNITFNIGLTLYSSSLHNLTFIKEKIFSFDPIKEGINFK
ncbi:MAG: polysialyltransferase family glycosyltransferase [bacterium]|nr:polysialyltransferase family glycosyltransferase [bacterium]